MTEFAIDHICADPEQHYVMPLHERPEWSALGELVHPHMAADDVERYADAVRTQAGYPEGLPHFRFYLRDGNRYDRETNTIWLHRGGFTPSTIVHEMAHFYSDEGSHGPTWRGHMARLLEPSFGRKQQYLDACAKLGLDVQESHELSEVLA